MTLSEYVDLVCTKMHRTDSASLENCKKYIRLRYKTIYDSRAWRDTQIPLGTTFAAEQVKILPYIVDTVIGCRWGTNIKLNNDQLWTVLTIDPSRFNEVGDPVSYSIISPSGVLLSPGGSKINIQTTDSSPNFRVSIYGTKSNEEVSETISITGSSAVESVNQYDEIFVLSKSDKNHNISVRRTDTSAQILYLKSYEQERKHQRIHFHSTPINSSPAIVLCKKKMNPLRNDEDAPELSGIDTALLAYAMADMLEDQRHYSKAVSKFQEAALAEKMMVEMEKEQSENTVRVIPYDGDFSCQSSKTSWCVD